MYRLLALLAAVALVCVGSSSYRPADLRGPDLNALHAGRGLLASVLVRDAGLMP